MCRAAPSGWCSRPKTAGFGVVSSLCCCLRERVKEEIHTHAKRRLPRFRGVFITVGIFPAVAEITFVRVVDQHASIVENAKALRRLAVMLVDLGQAARKV